MESDFGRPFDPNDFDELEEPPPVHIIYPRPSSQSFVPANDASLQNLICFHSILVVLNCLWMSR